MCYYLLPRASFMEHADDAFLVRWLKNAQVRLLRFTLPHASEILISAAFLVLLSIAFIPLMGREFLPPFNEGTLTVNVLAEPGISLAESDTIGRTAEDLMLKVPGVISTGRRTGRAELDEHARRRLLHRDRSEPQPQAARQGRHRGGYSQAACDLPGVSVNIGQPISHRLDHMQSGVQAQIALKLFGPDLAVLRQKAGRNRAGDEVGSRHGGRAGGEAVAGAGGADRD